VGKTGLLNAEKDVTELALNRRVEFKYFDRTGAPIAMTKQTQDIQVESGRKPAAGAKHAPAKKPTGAVKKAPPTTTKTPAKAAAPAPKAGTP
jgi:hypothetical protein